MPPTKRFGRTLVTDVGAMQHRYAALIAGSDHADLSGSCNTPVMVPLTGMSDKTLTWLRQLTHETQWPGTDFAPRHGWIGHKPETRTGDHSRIVHADVAVRCRKCPACLSARSALWRGRARQECAIASRTWFVTLTATMERHHYCRNIARVALSAQRLDWDRLEPDDRFKEQCKPLIAEFQRFMKRLRKHAPGLRFILVVERHKSGEPHLHMLLHEAQHPVRWKHIDAAWKWGFHVSKLVAEGPAAAAYVSKYLTKSAAARVRASVGYGASAAIQKTAYRPSF